jgi:hypothetical protein
MTAVAERKTNIGVMARVREALGARDLQRAISGTYHRLRLVLVVVALGLPIYLGLGGWLFWDVTLKDSLSDYYNADQSALRDVFIGSLIAAGVCLLIYQGFNLLEHWALNLAGVALIGVALFPTGASSEVHSIAAITFFALSFYVSLVRSADTLTDDLIPNAVTLKRYKFVYAALSASMFFFVGLTLALAWLFDPGRLIFFLETAGVWSFGAYWAIKTYELRGSDADLKASEGRISSGEYGWNETFRRVPLS